jgi:hypothetical protein
MYSREEDEQLVEVEGGACGSTDKRTNKPRKNFDDRFDQKETKENSVTKEHR